MKTKEDVLVEAEHKLHDLIWSRLELEIKINKTRDIALNEIRTRREKFIENIKRDLKIFIADTDISEKLVSWIENLQMKYFWIFKKQLRNEFLRIMKSSETDEKFVSAVLDFIERYEQIEYELIRNNNQIYPNDLAIIDHYSGSEAWNQRIRNRDEL